MPTKRRDCSGDTDTPSEYHSTDNDLGDGKSRANDDGSDHEADVPDCEDPFTTDSIGQGTPDEGTHQSADRSTRRNPSRIARCRSV
jgi:hypothetical protein